MFCRYCGAMVSGDFCESCGKPTGGAGGGGAGGSGGSEGGQGGGGQAARTGQGGHGRTGDRMSLAPAQMSLSPNGASALCYLATVITGAVFLAIAPFNQYRQVRFHAFQAIIFGVAWPVTWLSVYILSFAFSFLTGAYTSIFVTGFIILNYLVLYALGFGLWLALIISAAMGKELHLPLLWRLADRLAGPAQ